VARRLGDGGDELLVEQPARRDLPGRLAVRRADLAQRRIAGYAPGVDVPVADLQRVRTASRASSPVICHVPKTEHGNLDPLHADRLIPISRALLR
jgi:hypothetical protein